MVSLKKGGVTVDYSVHGIFYRTSFFLLIRLLALVQNAAPCVHLPGRGSSVGGRLATWKKGQWKPRQRWFLTSAHWKPKSF